MRLVRDLTAAKPASPSAVTVGVFDGVHLGHQKIIAGMIAAAHAAGRVGIAYTFEPHPAVATGHLAPSLLTTLEERAELLAALGVDILVAPPFTAATARTRASEFVEALIHDLRLAELWTGPDFALGFEREGTIPFLRRLGYDRGYTVQVVEPVQWQGNWVSSSRIRSALSRGKLGWANAALGRPYRLRGQLRGSGRPQGSGMLLHVPAGRLLPGPGAYACRAQTAQRLDLACVAYVDGAGGGPSQRHAVEVCFIDADDSPRDREMALDFHATLRVHAQEGPPVRDLLRPPGDVEQARQLLFEPD